MEKEQFLRNLEIALKKLICDRLFDETGRLTREELSRLVEEFIHENVKEYTLEELKETFVSARNALALFYEYQDAKEQGD